MLYTRFSKCTIYTYHLKEMLFTSSFRTNVLKLILCISCISIVCTLSLTPYLFLRSTEPNEITKRNRRYPTDLKYILFWKPQYNQSVKTDSLGQNIFVKQQCPFTNCYITLNKNLLNSESDFDAIVFDISDVKSKNISGINLSRSLQQKYIFKSFDSSEDYPLCSKTVDNFFNWTWTYKLNSDIPQPSFNIYNRIHKLVGPRRKVYWEEKMEHVNKFRDKIRTKMRAVAGIVYDCELLKKYNETINSLKKEVESYKLHVDIFGPCGDKKCPKGSIFKCYKLIEDTYFFHLTLENSAAKDYVSENIIRTMNYVILPIIVGGDDYTSFLPPGSYINTRDFDIKKLGAIIDYLVKRPKIYEYFFDWKHYYYFITRSKSYVCDLCTKLNHNNSYNERKTYRNLRQWWNSNYTKTCQSA